MADPIIGLNELVEGDTLGYLRQNDRNLIMARLMFPRLAADTVSSPTTTYPTASRGDLYLIGSATWTGTMWATASVGDIAIALSDDPADAQGWFFMTPINGMRLQDSADDHTYNGGWGTI